MRSRLERTFEYKASKIIDPNFTVISHRDDISGEVHPILGELRIQDELDSSVLLPDQDLIDVIDVILKWAKCETLSDEIIKQWYNAHPEYHNKMIVASSCWDLFTVPAKYEYPLVLHPYSEEDKIRLHNMNTIIATAPSLWAICMRHHYITFQVGSDLPEIFHSATTDDMVVCNNTEVYIHSAMMNGMALTKFVPTGEIWAYNTDRGISDVCRDFRRGSMIGWVPVIDAVALANSSIAVNKLLASEQKNQQVMDRSLTSFTDGSSIAWYNPTINQVIAGVHYTKGEYTDHVVYTESDTNIQVSHDSRFYMPLGWIPVNPNDVPSNATETNVSSTWIQLILKLNEMVPALLSGWTRIEPAEIGHDVDTYTLMLFDYAIDDNDWDETAYAHIPFTENGILQVKVPIRSLKFLRFIQGKGIQYSIVVQN